MQERKLLIGAFNDPNISEENYKLFAESGCNFMMMNRNHTKEQILEGLGYAEKFGISCLVNVQENESLADCDEYKKYESFAGFHIFDEPFVDDFDAIKAKIKPFEKRFPNKLFFVNLWPDQWDQNVSKLHAADYPNYVDRFCFEIIKNVSGERVLSVDSYPLMYAYDGSGKDEIDGRHLEILELFAKKARDYDAILHLYVQTMSYGKWHRKPTLEDMYFQFFTGIAYGVKRFSHFCYYTPGGTCEDFSAKDYAMVLKNDQPTDIYDFVKTANGKMQEFADFILNSAWRETAFIEGQISFDEYAGKHHLRSRKDKLDGIDAESEYEAIIGEFDYRGEKAYTVVNFTNPCHKKSNRVKITFPDKSKAKVRTVSGKEEVTLKGGVLQIRLPCGQGAVITDIV